MSEHDADATIAGIVEATEWPVENVRMTLGALVPGDRLPGGLVVVPGKTVPLPETRACEVCGAPMSVGKFARRRSTKTCSATCRFRKWQKNRAMLKAASTD